MLLFTKRDLQDMLTAQKKFDEENGIGKLNINETINYLNIALGSLNYTITDNWNRWNLPETEKADHITALCSILAMYMSAVGRIHPNKSAKCLDLLQKITIDQEYVDIRQEIPELFFASVETTKLSLTMALVLGRYHSIFKEITTEMIKDKFYEIIH